MTAVPEMVERVARALINASVLGEDGIADWRRPSDYDLMLARAAIAAMREPTQVMVDAPVIVADEDWSQRENWQAMIDAALQPGPSKEGSGC